MLAKKTSKNQLTLPKEVAEKFPGTDYFDVRVEGRVIELRPVRIEPEEGGVELARIREKIKRLGVTEDDVTIAVRRLLDSKSPQATIKRGMTIFDFRGALPDLGMSIDEIREKAVSRGVGADE